MGKFFQYVEGLEDEVMFLRAQNKALRNDLAEYETMTENMSAHNRLLLEELHKARQELANATVVCCDLYPED